MVRDVRPINRPQIDERGCKRKTIVLSDENLLGNSIFSATPPGPFVQQASRVSITSIDDITAKIGTYEAVVTFLSALNTTTFEIGCVGVGSYTFDNPKGVINFNAACSNLPYFTIVGGTGEYAGITGFIEFLIPIVGGFKHELTICK